MKRGTRRKRPTVTRKHSAFSGVLKCLECGENLNFRFNQGNHDIKFFSCQSHNSGLRKCSKTHYIRVEFLEWGLTLQTNSSGCPGQQHLKLSEKDIKKTL